MYRLNIRNNTMAFPNYPICEVRSQNKLQALIWSQLFIYKVHRDTLLPLPQAFMCICTLWQCYAHKVAVDVYINEAMQLYQETCSLLLTDDQYLHDACHSFFLSGFVVISGLQVAKVWQFVVIKGRTVFIMQEVGLAGFMSCWDLWSSQVLRCGIW